MNIDDKVRLAEPSSFRGDLHMNIDEKVRLAEPSSFRGKVARQSRDG